MVTIEDLISKYILVNTIIGVEHDAEEWKLTLAHHAETLLIENVIITWLKVGNTEQNQIRGSLFAS